MILDYLTDEVAADIQTDFCIVGAGPAGIALALELDKKGYSVALLESGGDTPHPDSQSFCDGDIVGRPYFPLISSRLRTIGGSTAHWSGWCGPMNPLDFETRQWIPDSGWPFPASELKGHYEKANQFIGLGPNEYSSQFWSKEYENFPALAENNLIARFFQFSSPPAQLGNKYRPLLADSKGITLYKNIFVTAINTSESTQTVESLTAQSLTNKKGNVVAKKFILAGGGIENPRLMLASTSRSSSGVGNANDLVGRYFMEHIEVKSAGISEYSAPLMRDLKRKKSQSGHEIGIAFCTSPEKQKELSIGNGASFFDAPSLSKEKDGWNAFLSIRDSALAGKIPNMKNFKELFSDLDSAVAVMALRARGKSVSSKIVQKGKLDLISLSEQTPNKDSRVTLSSRKDPFGNPLANLDWKLNEIDKRTIKSTMILIAAEFNRLNLGRVQLKNWLDHDDSDSILWPNSVRGGHHHMGTTRMSDTPSNGVVDKNCKVHGIDNLYLAGSSIFPTGGYVNPTLTIVAMSSRLGEFLHQQENL